MKNICVYGASSNALNKIYFEETYKLGQLIAKNDYGLVFGCGGTGVMGSVASGVRSVDNGFVIGVVPGFMDLPELVFHECDEKIVTNTMRERKQKMEDLASAFVCAPGGIGTFEEFFEILTLKQLRRHEKAIILLNSNHYYDKLLALMGECIGQYFAKKETLGLYSVASTPEEVIDLVKNYKFVPTTDEWLTHIG